MSLRPGAGSPRALLSSTPGGVQADHVISMLFYYFRAILIKRKGPRPSFYWYDYLLLFGLTGCSVFSVWTSASRVV